jgi:hypothetical protein
MRRNLLLLMAVLVASSLHAQNFIKLPPAAAGHSPIMALPLGLVTEVASTAHDLATFRDKKWTVLTLAQIAASSADARTSLYNLHHCATCQEVGVSRFVVGRSPDAHKYILAGLVEISVEAVTAHYLRRHGPIRKWYWRYAWTLPQTISLYEHTHASFHNAGFNY